jgi:flagellar biogenesis protein FliO
MINIFSIEYISQIIGAVVLVSGIFYGFAVVYKKYASNLGVHTGGNELFEIVKRQSMGGKHHIYLVKAAGRYYLMHGTTDELKLMDQISEDEVFKQYPELAPDLSEDK